MHADAHVSVLAPEVCRALAPALAPPTPGIFVDATVGLGGHSSLMLGQTRPSMAVVLDRDPQALSLARARLREAPCPVRFVAAAFSTVADALRDLGVTEVAAILADLGVSSMQLDTAARGFSFRHDAPLDMRMNPEAGLSAADILAEIDASALARILREYGDEPDAKRIAHAIVSARPRTTKVLADTVTEAMSAPQRRRLGRRIHPATRTFQALRIHVNDELGELDRFLDAAPPLLVVGGRLAIITFHSLEDRRVKHRFRELTRPPRVPPHVPLTERERPRPKFVLPRGTASGITPGDEELTDNPRSRSARLRVLERVAA